MNDHAETQRIYSKSILQELQLSQNDANIHQIMEVIDQVLVFPSNQQAQKHHRANKLGLYDLIKATNGLKQQFQKDKQFSINRCDCCQLIIHPIQIDQLEEKYGRWHWFYTPIPEISNFGQANRLYFQTLAFHFLLWISTFLIYGIYAFVTNIISSKNYSLSCFQTKMCGLSMIALGSKIHLQGIQGQYLFWIQSWLGLVTTILWFLSFIYKSYRDRSIQIQQDQNQITASDFTVIIKNMPKQISKQELQQKLNQYYKNPLVKQYIIQNPLDQNQNNYEQIFQIYSINHARSFHELQQLQQRQYENKTLKQIDLMENQIKHWILNYKSNGKLPFNPQQRRLFYDRIQTLSQTLQKQRIQGIQECLKNMKLKKQSNRKQKKSQKVITFVTFKYNFSRIYLQKLNNNTIYSKIKRFFSSIPVPRLQVDQIQLHISRAPQPQDIIWKDVGFRMKQIVLRKAITYSLTVFLLGLSFACIYQLSVFQDNTQNKLLSVLISVFITLVNMILGMLVQQLSKRQRDFRTTYYQTNLAIKTILAQLTNSILLTIVANYYIKHNIYETGGLSQDVIYLSISNAFIPPLLKVIDPYYIYLRILKWYKSRPSMKMQFQSQKQFNKLWQGYEYQVGYQSVYIIKTSIFCSFFLSMQPIISLFSAIGLYLMYYAQKYALFYHCTRPKPSSNLINQALNSFQHFVIISYSLGCLTWINFLPGSKFTSTIIPNIISISLGVFLILVPFQQIIDKWIKRNNQLMDYDKQRILINVQYQRINPFTHQVGMKNFLQYLREKKDTMKQNMNIFLSKFIQIAKEQNIVDGTNIQIEIPSYQQQNLEQSKKNINEKGKIIRKNRKQKKELDPLNMMKTILNIQKNEKEAKKQMKIERKKKVNKKMNINQILMNNMIKKSFPNKSNQNNQVQNKINTNKLATKISMTASKLYQ